MPSLRSSYRNRLEAEQQEDNLDNPIEQAAARAIEEKLSEQSEQRPAEPAKIQEPSRDEQYPELIQRWAKEHPQYFVEGSPERRRALAADIEARNAGHAFGSEDYLENVETALGLRPKTPQPLPRNDYATPQRMRSYAAAMPVSRESVSWSTGKPTNYSDAKLSAEQREMAHLSGISEQEYAANVKRLEQYKKDGTIQT